jgi:putative ABC transport system permease protein
VTEPHVLVDGDGDGVAPAVPDPDLDATIARVRAGGGGGLAARRAIVRWALRLFRREWRQQVLVLALLTFAVAVAVGGSAAVYGVTWVESGDFGTADNRLEIGTGDQAQQQAAIDAARAAYGTVEVIGRWSVPLPGTLGTLEVRAQDPHGPYGQPMLRLLAGRYPRSDGEAAMTADALAALHAHVGGQVELGDRGHTRVTVVGRIENPSRLDDQFVLVAPSAAQLDRAESLTLLVHGGDQQMQAFHRHFSGPVGRMVRGHDSQAGAAALTLIMATVVLLLVSLIAAAGFVVIAQRRLRQLGMLAAIGANEAHLRLVMLANGVVVGVVAAVAGTSLGLAGWIVAAPHLEHAAGHRLDALHLPWWLAVGGMALAVLTATAAAWWPSRTMARVPIVRALSARPPEPQPTHRSVLVAVALVILGFVCLAYGIDARHDHVQPALVIVGTLATAGGVLLVSPAVIRALPALAARMPLATRLALRDLGRYQARSGAALAAISLGLGIPVAVIVIASADEYNAETKAGLGNLADDQLLFHVGNPPNLLPVVPAAALDQMGGQVDRLASSLGDDARVLPLDVAVDPSVPSEVGFDGGPGGRPTDMIGVPEGPHTYSGHTPYVADPALLRSVGIDPAAVDPSTDLVTPRSGALLWAFKRGPEATTPHIQRLGRATYGSLPDVFVTARGLERRHLTSARAGWLVDTGHPLTDAQLTHARDVATRAGLYLEAREAPRSNATVRTVATVAGVLVALGILSMTVGLIRGEAAGDLRTLTATGASSRVRRAITAATAAALAFLGVVLATIGAYVALTAGYLRDLTPLGNVPVAELLVILVGLPLVAALSGYLLAGREPPTLARPPLD